MCERERRWEFLFVLGTAPGCRRNRLADQPDCRSSEKTDMWRRPDRAVWWMALLFVLGSTMFLVPALAALASSATWIAVTFFCGSIFFTSAALIQLVTAADLPHRFRPRARRRPLRPRAWLPATVDWLAATIQLAGTVMFNISTFAATSTCPENSSGQTCGCGRQT